MKYRVTVVSHCELLSGLFKEVAAAIAFLIRAQISLLVLKAYNQILVQKSKEKKNKQIFSFLIFLLIFQYFPCGQMMYFIQFVQNTIFKVPENIIAQGNPIKIPDPFVLLHVGSQE